MTVRAWVAELDGEPIGIAGYYLIAGRAMVFSDMRDEMKRFPVLIMKLAIEFMGSIQSTGLPLVCTASTKIPNAEKFLQRLGWLHVGPSEAGEVYTWHS